MSVDGLVVNKKKWLEKNKVLVVRRIEKIARFDQNVSFPLGNFNWFNNCVDDPDNNIYMDFVTWKKTCYIIPSYKLFNKKDNKVINFLKLLYKKKKISIGLVHPKGKLDKKEKGTTSKYIKFLYDSPEITICM